MNRRQFLIGASATAITAATGVPNKPQVTGEVSGVFDLGVSDETIASLLRVEASHDGINWFATGFKMVYDGIGFIPLPVEEVKPARYARIVLEQQEDDQHGLEAFTSQRNDLPIQG